MYDGYARGFAQASGELVVFSHDDIRFAVPDFAARLADTMLDADFAGVAGTTKVSGPALLWSGHPHLHGTVTHKAPADKSYELALTSLRGPRIRQAQGLDGVFIAARREWVKRVGFDTERIPGFHLYDLDFSYRAHLAGARLTIACDLALIHQSRGNFDAGWNTAQAAFAAKFPELNSEPGKFRHWYNVSLPDEASVRLHYAKLFAAWGLELF
jgi:GT2 family glycosyltransferase